MNDYISALDMAADSDSAKIQSAIQTAKATGTNRVCIPGKGTPWIIQETIALPSDIEILIDGAHMIMADDTFCQMFATENYLKKERRLQTNIEIHSINGAVLDGGKYNGLSEYNSLQDAVFENIVNENKQFVAVEIRHGAQLDRVSFSELKRG